jgi:hypothetical protein
MGAKTTRGPMTGNALIFGECIAIADAVVSAGDRMKAVAVTGNLTPTTTPGDEIAGTAKSSAAAQGDEFVLFLNQQRY